MRGAWLCLLIAVPLLASCASIGPRVPLPRSTATPPLDFHRDLDSFLRRHVDADGRVDYRAASVDRADLDRYVAQLARISPDSHRDWFPTDADRLAYWINAYNAFVIHLVLHYYPITSVRDIRPPVPFFFLPRLAGFFVFQRVTLGGRETSLRALEDGVIRGRFSEPRVHFALNCASRSCPRLPNRGFTPAGLDTELEREAGRFVAEERNVRIDVAGGTLFLSSIFRWYEADFADCVKGHRAGEEATLRRYLRPYLSETQAAQLHACARCRVEFVPYDWGLNDRHAAAE